MHPQLTHLLCEQRRADLMLRGGGVMPGAGRGDVRGPVRLRLRLRALRPARVAGTRRGGHRLVAGR